jgi:hypothetical protein
MMGLAVDDDALKPDASPSAINEFLGVMFMSGGVFFGRVFRGFFRLARA